MKSLALATKRLLVFFFLLGFPLAAFSQTLTGSIYGTINDKEGNPLPGATVTISSPSLMGTQSVISSEEGHFRFPTVPPGEYTIEVQMPGFKTAQLKNVIVRVGMKLNLKIELEVAAIEEEVTVTAGAPVIDIRQSKIAVTVDQAVLTNVPIRRDVHDVINSLPGANFSEETGWAGAHRMTSVHGSSVRDNVYSFDGVNMNDSVNMHPVTNINFDVIEEVEAMLGGLPAEVGFATGAYVNIVTRSGGNNFSGGFTFHHVDENLYQTLWSDEQFQALGVSKPTLDKSSNDLSLSLGGPILKDKLWFFSNYCYLRTDKRTMFLPWDLPYPHPAGYAHTPWPDWYHREWLGFLKLTSQLTEKLKVMGMVNYTDTFRPIDQSPSPRTLFAATNKWDESVLSGTLNITYILNPNSFLEVKGGYVNRYFMQPFQEEAYKGNVAIWNYGTNFSTGQTTYEQSWKRLRYQLGASGTWFKDELLGASHEFKGGLETSIDDSNWSWWRKDPLYWQWYRGSPYYYGTTTASDVVTYGLPPGSVGIGYSLIGAWICGPKEGDNPVRDIGTHLSAFIQDNVTIADRLTFNLGVRFDYSRLDKTDIKKGEAGNEFVLWLGETYVVPYTKKTYPETFPNGINPWLADEAEDWKGVIKWTYFSPRIGFTFDLFGNRKTALKAFAGRTVDYLSLRFALAVSPFDPGWSWRIYWFDLNKNQQLDKEDHYWVPPLYDFRKQEHKFAYKMMDPDIKAPHTDEYTVGISHELAPNVSVGLNYYYKHKKDIWQRTYWNPDSGQYWYHWDQPEAKKYWVPFTTIVPPIDNYPAREVTIYQRKIDGPAPFYRGTTLPELVMKYQGLEFVVNKRMSNGWQFSGSLVYSKTYGNMAPTYSETAGWTGIGIHPNYYVNRYGRQSTDRPIAIKLMGVFQLPFGINLSAYYQHFSGTPWGRTVQIRPPADWCVANGVLQEYYSVYIEPPDSYRYPSTDNVDLRIEKEFRIRRIGSIGAYVDVLNLLGSKSVSVGLNPIDRYTPSAPNTMEPDKITKSASYKLISGVSGMRYFRLCLRYRF